MDIEKVCLITFSATHTSRRVGEAIVQGIMEVRFPVWM